MADDLDNPLWQFSLWVYGNAEVERACLRLQDDHGADVSLILFCCWLGVAGYGRIEDRRLGEAIAAATHWSEKSVRPLRALRRRLKEDPRPVSKGLAEATRRQVLAAEIEAERALQGLLFEMAQGWGEPITTAKARAGDIRANVETYLSAAGIVATNAVEDDVSVIMGRADRAEIGN